MGLSNRVLTLPYTKIGVNGTGDFQVALKSPHLETQEDLFTYGDINKFAKFKAIVRPRIQYEDQMKVENGVLVWKSVSELTAEGKIPWWIGQDGQHGLTFTTYPGLGSPSSGFLAALLAGNLSWGYTRPNGTSYRPMRPHDFHQYYMDAPKPVEGVYDNLQLYGGGSLKVQLDENRGDALSVQLSDLTVNNSSVSGWYVGVLIYKSSSQWTFAFSNNTIGGGNNLDVEFSNMTSYAGAVVVVPFLSSVRNSQGVDPGAGIFISADVAPQSVTIQPEVQSVVTTINAQWKDTLYVRVGYAVNIINNTYSNFTVNNLLIALFDGYQNINTRSLGTVTIPARSNQEYTGVFIVSNYDSGKTYQLVVSSDSQYVSGSKVVDAPRT